MPKTASVPFQKLLSRLQADHPTLQFTAGNRFAWHAGRQEITFCPEEADQASQEAIWALLHEVGHALLAHGSYTYDIELLKMEVAAWAAARPVAAQYGVTLDEDHIEDCLDTYRDWLHLRATCPTCGGRALQASRSRYSCFNCQSGWRVSPNRLCRPYRLKTARKAQAV